MLKVGKIYGFKGLYKDWNGTYSNNLLPSYLNTLFSDIAYGRYRMKEAKDLFDERFPNGLRLIDNSTAYCLFHAVGTNRVYAGCRNFTIKRAIEHWNNRKIYFSCFSFESPGKARAIRFIEVLKQLKKDLKDGKIV